jgi:peptidyl-prolyl cis-trans isomerase D
MPRTRNVIALSALVPLVLACAERDPAAGPSPPAAWIAGDTLSVEALARLLVLAQPLSLEPAVVEEIARHWLHVRSLAALEPERVAADLPPEIFAEALSDSAVSRMRAALRGDPADEAARTADRIFAAGQIRLIMHVVRRVNAPARPDERELERRTAVTIAEDLARGGSWDVANARSEDVAARNAGGVLGLVEPGDLPPPLDSIAFALPPGAISGVVESPVGFHVLRRPRLAEVRQEFTNRLATHLAERMDRELAESMAMDLDATLHPAAAVRMRELALEAWSSLAASDAIGTWSGGVLRAGRVAVHLAALPVQTRTAIAEAPAAEREALAGRLLLREILRWHANTAGFTASHADTAAARAAALDEMQTVRRVARLNDIAANGDAAAAHERATLRARRYLEELAARRVAPEALSPSLAVYLTRVAGGGFARASVRPAIDRARTLLDAAGYPGGGRQ